MGCAVFPLYDSTPMRRRHSSDTEYVICGGGHNRTLHRGLVRTSTTNSRPSVSVTTYIQWLVNYLGKIDDLALALHHYYFASLYLRARHPREYVSCVDAMVPVGESTSNRNVEDEMIIDYDNMLRVLSVIKLLQQGSPSRAIDPQLRTLEQHVLSVLCFMNNALLSFGQSRPRDVIITPAVDTCSANDHLYMSHVRDMEILVLISDFSDRLYQKYTDRL